jgi:cardiolipin synthase
MVRQSRPRKPGNAKASLVVDEQHSHFVLRARDEAQQRIFLSSHRLGPSSRPGVLIPLMEACRSGCVRAEVHFGRFDGITRLAQSQWVADAQTYGVTVAPTKLDGLHAKVLAWDGNSALITSLNWLSAHPTGSRVPREIGVWIELPGISDIAINALTASPSDRS